jgi:hypothetical protein
MTTSQQDNEKSMVETMNDILGSNYQIISQKNADPVVIAKLPDEDLAPKNSVVSNEDYKKETSQPTPTPTKPNKKSKDDYLFQFYLGSLTVVGLFILFRMIQKSK